MDPSIWEAAVKFHGHECPGLAIGVRACQIAMEKMNISFSTDEDIVCITENDACGVDGVQFISGCTLGKGNLIYRGTGKMAFSFFNRLTGDSLRLMYKKSQTKMDRPSRQNYILTAPAEAVFELKKPNYTLPQKARSFDDITCEICQENAPEHKIRIQAGKKVCLDCYEDYSRGW